MKKCPFCAEEIQDAAIVCRYCNRDLTGKPDQAQVIEQTSKRYKAFQGVGCVGLVVGMYMIYRAVLGDYSMGTTLFAFAVFLLGLASYINGKIGAWWHHR